VESGLKKLSSAQTKVNQSRLDCFFKTAGVSQSKMGQPSKTDKKGGSAAVRNKSVGNANKMAGKK
jgi:altronate dehydratase